MRASSSACWPSAAPHTQRRKRPDEVSAAIMLARIRFNNGLGQSYTPAAIGADGTIYAINAAVLFAVGS